LSRFRSKVGPERLSRIVDQAVEVLVKTGRIKGQALALDSTFIKAYNRRNLDNRTGYSDPESRIGRAVKAKDLGYRLHLAVDVKSELPVAMIVVSANENEKKHSIGLFERASVREAKKALGRCSVQRNKPAGSSYDTWSITCYSLPEKPV
jgi:transposase, IS5 family